MKKLIKIFTISICSFFFVQKLHATLEKVTLNIENLPEDIIEATQIDITFMHHVDKIIWKLDNNTLLLEMLVETDLIQSNIQFLLGDKYFLEFALSNAHSDNKFNFANNSTNEIEIYKEILDTISHRTNYTIQMRSIKDCYKDSIRNPESQNC